MASDSVDGLTCSVPGIRMCNRIASIGETVQQYPIEFLDRESALRSINSGVLVFFMCYIPKLNIQFAPGNSLSGEVHVGLYGWYLGFLLSFFKLEVFEFDALATLGK